MPNFHKISDARRSWAKVASRSVALVHEAVDRRTSDPEGVGDLPGAEQQLFHVLDQAVKAQDREEKRSRLRESNSRPTHYECEEPESQAGRSGPAPSNFLTESGSMDAPEPGRTAEN